MNVQMRGNLVQYSEGKFSLVNIVNKKEKGEGVCRIPHPDHTSLGGVQS